MTTHQVKNRQFNMLNTKFETPVFRISPIADKAAKEGCEAAKKGLSLENNPYKDYDDAHWSAGDCWEEGFKLGRQTNE